MPKQNQILFLPHRTFLHTVLFFLSSSTLTNSLLLLPPKIISYNTSPSPLQMVSSTTTTPSDPVHQLNLPTPIILGSASYTRKLILSEMNISYHLMVYPIDEKSIGDRNTEPASNLVTKIAKAKCDALVDGLLLRNQKDGLMLPSRNNGNDNDDDDDEGWIILTADQVVTHDNTILEKPESIDQAREFVSKYANSPPSTVGACVLTHIPSCIQVGGVDTATIYFKSSIAEGDLIEALVEDGAPVLSCAGGLMIEHPLVREHLERIDGTEDSVMGLSKDLVLRLLEELKGKLDDWNGEKN